MEHLTRLPAHVTPHSLSASRNAMDTNIDGTHHAYTDRGTGTPVVLLHAFPLNRSMWDDQVAFLSQGFRVIAIDLRGHGDSKLFSTPYTLDDLATDIKELLDSLDIQQAVFAGLSMGGYILFAFYRLFPARVKGLILADTRAQADAADERAGRLQMIRTAETQGPQAIADIMLPRLLSPGTIAVRSDLVSKVRSMIVNNSPETIVADLYAMIDRANSIPSLSQIACPTLIIVGELDRGTPPSDAQFMAKHITGARLAVLAEAAHLSNLENPEAFNTAMHAFLNEIGQGDSRL